MEIQIKLQPKQKKALQALSNNEEVGYGGARGGGKSFLVRAWQILRRFKYPGTTGVIFRKTYSELYGNHIIKLYSEYPELMKYYHTSEKVIKFPTNPTSYLFFKHLQHKDSVYNYQGQEFDDIAIDEAQQHSKEVIEVLRASNRTTRKGIKPKMLLTFNPGGIGHKYLKRVFIEKDLKEAEKNRKFEFVQAKVFDNQILLQNDPQYLINLQTLPTQRRKAWLEGDWSVFEGQFFENFQENVHVTEPKYNLKDLPDNYTLRLGWDDGMLNPRAVYLAVQNNDSKVDVVYEYYKTGETANQAAFNIKNELKELGVYDKLIKNGLFVYDPSMDIKNNQTGRSTSDIVQSIFDNIKKQPANNNRIEGARRVMSYLQWSPFEEPLLQIWNTCPNLIEEIPALVHSSINVEDVDTEGMDHGYDALRYILMSLTKLPSRMAGEEVKKEIRKPVIIKYKPMGGV